MANTDMYGDGIGAGRKNHLQAATPVGKLDLKYEFPREGAWHSF
jgi:hypothetical protein